MVSTHLKNLFVKLDHFPRDRVANKKSLFDHHPGPGPHSLFQVHPLGIQDTFCQPAAIWLWTTRAPLTWHRKVILLMAEIRRSPVEVGSWSHYLRYFIHPRWLGMGFLNHQQYVLSFNIKHWKSIAIYHLDPAIHSFINWQITNNQICTPPPMYPPKQVTK